MRYLLTKRVTFTLLKRNEGRVWSLVSNIASESLDAMRPTQVNGRSGKRKASSRKRSASAASVNSSSNGKGSSSKDVAMANDDRDSSKEDCTAIREIAVENRSKSICTGGHSKWLRLYAFDGATSSSAPASTLKLMHEQMQ